MIYLGLQKDERIGRGKARQVKSPSPQEFQPTPIWVERLGVAGRTQAVLFAVWNLKAGAKERIAASAQS